MIQHGLPFEEYLSIPAVSASGLKMMARSMAHYAYTTGRPSISSPSQALGIHVHGLILEPETYRFAIVPEVDRRTKEGKQQHAEFVASAEGANIVTAEQHGKALEMRDRVMAQPYARALLEDGHSEVTATWKSDGIPCKARIDRLPSAHQANIDIKTAADASEQAFANAAGRYKYAYQSDWYSRATDANGLGSRPMIFVVVENEPPHSVALYQIDEESIHAAHMRIDLLLEQYRECHERGEWPAYPREIQTLILPKWSW
jgi:hypothetical protein